MLQIFLALDRCPDVVVTLCIDQALQAVFPGEATDDAFPMFPYAPCKIAGDADVERPVRPIRHHVDPAALHRRIVGIEGPKRQPL
jgi:hypothetical protein